MKMDDEIMLSRIADEEMLLDDAIYIFDHDIERRDGRGDIAIYTTPSRESAMRAPQALRADAAYNYATCKVESRHAPPTKGARRH